jgi:hypothetical protein
MVLTNPPPQQQKMIIQVIAPPPGGNAKSSTTNVMMVKSMMTLNTRDNKYYSTEGKTSSKDPPLIFPPNVPLAFEKPAFEPTIYPPKGVL